MVTDPFCASSITLEVVRAGFGDCLPVSCPVWASTWRGLVDTMPDECYATLRSRMQAIPPGADGKRHIDLFVVTHIDYDHIGGAAQLLNDDNLGLAFDDIWFNAPPRRVVRGVAEGQSSSEILGASDRNFALERGLVQPADRDTGRSGRGRVVATETETIRQRPPGNAT